MLITLILRAIHLLVPHHLLAFFEFMLVLLNGGVAANAANAAVSPSASPAVAYAAVVCYVSVESRH